MSNDTQHTSVNPRAFCETCDNFLLEDEIDEGAETCPNCTMELTWPNGKPTTQTSDFSKENAAYFVDILDKDDNYVDVWQIQKGVDTTTIINRLHYVLDNWDSAVKIVIRKAS